MSDRDIVDLFERLGFVSDIESIAFTAETVEDFWIARQRFWHRPGEVEKYEERGLLVVKMLSHEPINPREISQS